ncbi:MAG: hypothetical protein U0W40_07660 [Acidimicrobiia bacterium]
MGKPERVLDPAAGWGEFINGVPAPERWMVGAVEFPGHRRDPAVHALFGDIREVELPQAHFGGVFVSNLLEHFATRRTSPRSSPAARSPSPVGRVMVTG